MALRRQFEFLLGQRPTDLLLSVWYYSRLKPGYYSREKESALFYRFMQTGVPEGMDEPITRNTPALPDRRIIDLVGIKCPIIQPLGRGGEGGPRGERLGGRRTWITELGKTSIFA
jgi:hypothetical protein